MPPLLAAGICAVCVAGLFALDRDGTSHGSKALWIPLTWLLIVGSRPVSEWLNLGQQTNGNDFLMGEGSPLDRNVFIVLLIMGLLVLIARRRLMGNLLYTNTLLVLFFSYCLISILWSDYPDIALKRWIKAIGDLVMVLVIVTDRDVSTAVHRVFSRVGFLLLPASILFIRYFGDLGRGYDPDGVPMNTGVTTNKNTLGVVTLVLSLGAFWQVVNLFHAKETPNRRRRLLAQCGLLVCGVTVLQMAQSATAVLCFGLGAVLILVTNVGIRKRQPAAVHVVVALLVLTAALTVLLGDSEWLLHALGRQGNLTGRTEIWQAVLQVASAPVFGTGFESFWLGPRVQQVWSQLSDYMHVNEAHNGYLEVYLNLGWVGICLIACLLISAYRRAVSLFRTDPAIGSLALTFIVCAATYSITEAGFRLLNPIWIFFLLSVVIVPNARVAEQPEMLPIVAKSNDPWAFGTEAVRSGGARWHI